METKNNILNNEEELKSYSDLTNLIIKEINKIRSNPQSYISIIQNIIDTHIFPLDSDKSKFIYKRKDTTSLLLEEGKEGFLEAIDFLSKQSKTKELVINEFLTKTAWNHAVDIGTSGSYSHIGNDNSDLKTRIERYCNWDIAIAENIVFNEIDAESIIVSLIVNDGDKQRTQRNNLMNKEFNFIGVAGSDHFSENKNTFVIVFANNIRSKEDNNIIFFERVNNNKEVSYENDINKETREVKGGVVNSSDYDIVPKNTSFNAVVNPMQEVDKDAPNDAVSVRYENNRVTIRDVTYKKQIKYYTLLNGSTHIVENLFKEEN